jgi:hypothetical protein
MQPIPSPHRAASAGPLREPVHSHQRAAPAPPPRAPLRAKLTDRLLYRWERLREEQRQRAWGMVQEMRATVAQERQRRRRREGRYALLIVLVVAVDAALVYLVLHGATF